MTDVVGGGMYTDCSSPGWAGLNGGGQGFTWQGGGAIDTKDTREKALSERTRNSHDGDMDKAGLITQTGLKTQSCFFLNLRFDICIVRIWQEKLKKKIV